MCCADSREMLALQRKGVQLSKNSIIGCYSKYCWGTGSDRMPCTSEVLCGRSVLQRTISSTNATLEGFHDPEGPSMRFRVKSFQVPNPFRLQYLGPKPSIIRIIEGDFDWNRPESQAMTTLYYVYKNASPCHA